MTMPNMTGEDLAAELMRIKPATPVILCMGFSTKIDNKKATAMGIRAFVSKPVLKKEIAETIWNVLDGTSKVEASVYSYPAVVKKRIASVEVRNSIKF